jgi:uncharacterized protein (TIGR04255 family)
LDQAEHPSYPNPTIAEALCEIHFAYPTDKTFRARLAGEVFKVVQDEYPFLEPRVETAFEIKAGPEGFEHRVFPPAPSQRMLFRHASRNLLFQLGEGVLTLNVLRPYPGWRTMSADLIALWEKASPVIEPTRVSRVGLRFINRIPRVPEGSPAEHWLRPTDYLPAAPLKTRRGFFSQVSVGDDEHNRMIVTLAESKSGDGSEVVLDIDRIVEEDIAARWEELERRISRMHADVWTVFSSAKSDGLERLLRGKEGG